MDTLKQDQEDQRKQEYTNAPPSTTSKFPVQCRYCSRGQCTKGKGCRFLHQKNEPADLSEHSDADPTPEETTRTITIQPKQTNRNRQDEPKPHHSKDTRRHTPPPREEQTKKRKERKPHHHNRDDSGALRRNQGNRKRETIAHHHQRYTEPNTTKETTAHTKNAEVTKKRL